MEQFPREGFDAFAEQLAAQIAVAGSPQHENALHHCLALGFQSAYDLAPGDIIFERGLGPGNVDLWFRPWDLALEVKFNRAMPGGRNRPSPSTSASCWLTLVRMATYVEQ